MLNALRHSWLFTLVAALLPTVAPADQANDFVRDQAAKAAFVVDVAMMNRIATDMFRVDGFAVMRMTHEHWEFADDITIENAGHTYAWRVNSNAEDSEYDVRRFAAALPRNNVISDDVRDRAQQMVDLIDQLRELSLELADIYDTGDVTEAGDHYHGRIVPVYESIRGTEATITSELSREIRQNALEFRF